MLARRNHHAVARLSQHGPEPMTPTDRRFGDEFLIDLDPRAAAQRAGLPPEAGSRLLAKPRIQTYIAGQSRRRLTRLEVNQDYVLRRWVQVAEADPRELVEHLRVPCRFCHGHDHRYQFTAEELRRAQQDHQLSQLKRREDDRVPLDDLGGDGYDIWKPVHAIRNGFDHNCPECHGEGVGHVVYHDTRYLSPGAASLYLGVKTTASGMEILMRDKGAAEVMIARHIGMFNERRPISTFNPDSLTDDELDAVLIAYTKRRAEATELPEPSEEELDAVVARIADAGSEAESLLPALPGGEAEPG